MNITLRAFVICITLCCFNASISFAQSPDGLWQRDIIVKKTSTESRSTASVFAEEFAFSAQTANASTLQSLLQKAPKEGGGKGVSFYYPLPNGKYIHLEAFSAPVMAPKLAAKYPQIQSYQVYGAEDDRVSGRIGFSPKGLFGYLYTMDGTVIIQPESGFSSGTKSNQYRVYYQQALNVSAATAHQELPEVFSSINSGQAKLNESISRLNSIGQQVRVFRLALSLTGEATRLLGGTKEQGLAFLVETVNYLNFIYTREAGIRLELIENNDQLIFLNPNTDPFEIPLFAHTENNEYLNSPAGIPDADYDIGHVINTHGGGQAGLAQVCNNTHKGTGRTGLGTNGFEAGSAQWINRIVGVFAHEIGHQFGARHTQNSDSTCNRFPRDAWEVHSGSTIMGYAGLCAPSLQSSSDPVLHAGSRDVILAFISTGGRVNCGSTETIDYEPPIINAGEDRFIPTSTPFMLTAELEGGSSESLSYTWDQMDLGPATSFNPATWRDNGTGPLFRSFAPSESSTRVFPNLDVVLSDDLNSFSEILPTTEREINFRVTGRSGRGLGQDDIKLNVVGNAGPFQVTQPIGTAFDNNQSLQVEWLVANTNAAPINCSHVDIDLSVDGGANFDQSLIQQTPNDGTANVTLPAVAGQPVRLRVKCSDNIFFAVSPATDLNANTDSGLITAIALGDRIIVEGTSPDATELVIRVERQNTRDQLTMEYFVAVADNLQDIASLDDFADDFEPEGVLVLPIGQKSTTLTLPIRADSKDEDQLERFLLEFSNFSSGNCPRCTFIFSIRDDDEPGDDNAPVEEESLCFIIPTQNNKLVPICL